MQPRLQRQGRRRSEPRPRTATSSESTRNRGSHTSWKRVPSAGYILVRGGSRTVCVHGASRSAHDAWDQQHRHTCIIPPVPRECITSRCIVVVPSCNSENSDFAQDSGEGFSGMVVTIPIIMSLLRVARVVTSTNRTVLSYCRTALSTMLSDHLSHQFRW